MNNSINENTKMDFCEYFYNDYKEKDDKLFLDFYNNVFSYSKKYDYVVLTTRRCFRLINCIHKEYGSISTKEMWPKFISSQAVRFNKDLIKDKSVLLVDDVMLHGKAVYSLYCELRNTIQAKKIDTFVLARNNEQPDFYFRSTKKDYYSMFLLTTNLWENLSNRIVKYFCSKGEPYTSYLCDFQFDDSNGADLFEQSIKIRKDKLEQECGCVFTSVTFDDDNLYPDLVRSKYYDSEITFMDLPLSCKNNIIDKIILRKYDYKDINKTVYIPYCELKPIKSDVLKNSWTNLKEKNILTKDSKLYKVESSIDMYKVYTALFSLYFWDLDDYSPNVDIEKSYYDGFCEEIQQLNKKLQSICPTTNSLNKFLCEIGLDNYNYTDSAFNNSLYQEEFDAINLLNILDKKNKIEKLYTTISSISEKEEYKFSERIEKRYNGSENFNDDNLTSTLVPLDFIMKKIGNDCCIDASIIALLDAGFLSHVIAEFESEYVAVAVKTGEQSYRIPYMLNPVAFICAAKFYDLFTYLENKELSLENVNSFINFLKETFPNEDTIINTVNDNLTKIYNNKLLNVFEKGKELITAEELKNSQNWIQAINKYFI